MCVLLDRGHAEFWNSDSYAGKKVCIHEGRRRYHASLFASCVCCVIFTKMGISVADLFYDHRRISLCDKFAHAVAWENVRNCS